MTKQRPRPGFIRRLRRTVRIASTALLLSVLGSTQPALAGWWDTAAEAREGTLVQLRQEPRDHGRVERC